MTATDAPGGPSLFYARFSSLPGAGLGGLLLWQPSGLPAGVSLRAGGARGAGGEIAGFGGVDVSSPLVRRSEEMPLDLNWSTGIGLGVGDYILLTLPVGVTAGRAWSSGQVWFHPWAGAHAVMDGRIGGNAPDDEFEVSPSAELGLDVAFDRRRRVVLRGAASLGDRSAFVVGVALGAGVP